MKLIKNFFSIFKAVRIVCEAERSNEQHMLNPSPDRQWINPSKRLVDRAIEKWNGNNLRADNTSVVTVMLDPPGPPRAQVLKRQRELRELNSNQKFEAAARGSVALVTNSTNEDGNGQQQQQQQQQQRREPLAVSSSSENNIQKQHQQKRATATAPASSAANPSSLAIISRYPNSRNREAAQGHSLQQHHSDSKLLHDFQRENNSVADSTSGPMTSSAAGQKTRRHRCQPPPLPQRNISQAASSRPLSSLNDIQCNEVSSSDDDTSPPKQKSLKKVPAKSPRLSRELSALQLDSPGMLRSGGRRKNVKFPQQSVKKGRRVRNDSKGSDTENEVVESNVVSNRKLRSSSSSALSTSALLRNVEVQCSKLDSKLRNLDKKVSKKADSISQEVRLLKTDLASAAAFTPSLTATTNSHFLRSQDPQPRSLRPRTPAQQTSTPSSSARKRKRLDDGPGPVVGKSPKLSSKPAVVATRSKTARVLQLKK